MTDATKVEQGNSETTVSWKFRNISGGDVVLQDLGYKAPSGMFSPEIIKIGETKDLNRKYSALELQNSKSLVIALEEMKLLVPAETPETDQVVDPLRSLTSKNKGIEGASFQDPTVNVFDEKLNELREKERREDEDTKKRV